MQKLLKPVFKRMTHTTMRVSILSLFLSLMISAFSITLLFLYYKDYQALSNISKQTIDLTGQTILEKVSSLLNETERITRTSGHMIHSASAVSPNNQSLRDYMLQFIKYHPDIPYLLIGTEEDSYLEIGNLKVSLQKHFFSDPSKPLPSDAVYEWQYFKRTGTDVQGMSLYFDEDFKQVAKEPILQSNYDPKTRPWYLTGMQNGRFSWTDVYTFYDTGDPGITAVVPLRDASGKIFGVLGADLSFNFLSQFLAEQKIGKSGRSFIIDKKTGAILLPVERLLAQSTIPNPAVLDAYSSYLVNGESDFDFSYQGIRYLAHFATFPIAEESNWVIAVIVPFSDFFSAFQKTQVQALFIVILICFLSSLAIIYFAKKLSNPIKALSKRVDEVRHLNLAVSDGVQSNIKEIAEMDLSVNSMALAFRSFIQYVPKEIVQQLLSQNKELTLGGEKKEVTILFSDIANFTRIAEEISTESLMTLLGEYFDGLSQIILRSQGTIDKYIGDSIMAFWNAPLDVPNHPEICAGAVLKCAAFVKSLNERRKKEGKPEFATRFGIHTGAAIVGNIGTPERMNYTLIGDTVNSASRLQGVNKIYGTTLLISEQVRQKLSPAFIARPLDIVEVKGKKQKITIFELMAKEGDDPLIAPTAEVKALAELFTKAYTAYYANDRSLAKKLFSQLHRDFPEDIPTKIYLERLAR